MQLRNGCDAVLLRFLKLPWHSIPVSRGVTKVTKGTQLNAKLYRYADRLFVPSYSVWFYILSEKERTGMEGGSRPSVRLEFAGFVRTGSFSEEKRV